MQTQNKSVQTSTERISHLGIGGLDAQIQAGECVGRDGSEAIRNESRHLTSLPPSSWIKMSPCFWGALGPASLDGRQAQVVSNDGIIQSVILGRAQAGADDGMGTYTTLKAAFGHVMHGRTALGACRCREGGE